MRGRLRRVELSLGVIDGGIAIPIEVHATMSM
jgi:hypothetical protein